MASLPVMTLAAGWCAFAVATLAVRVAAADDAGIGDAEASLACEASEAPGRVRCEVEARVPAGGVLRWGDVVLVRAPDFVVPLRGRIGPHEATTREPTRWRWAFAVVAKERGHGPLDARVRLVICRGDAGGFDGACTPVTLDVTTTLTVGKP